MEFAPNSVVCGNAISGTELPVHTRSFCVMVSRKKPAHSVDRQCIIPLDIIMLHINGKPVQAESLLQERPDHVVSPMTC